MEALGRATGQERFDGLPPMNGRPIPHDEERAGARAQEQAQEAHHRGAVVRPRLGRQEETPSTAQRPDRRAVIAGEGDAQDRGLSTPGPGPHVMGEAVEPGLISPDDAPVRVGRLVLRAGQRCSHQPRMAASSRGVARSTGRCTLEPKRCNRRARWEGSEVTPKVRRITAPTRWHVQTWPRKP